MFCPIVAHIKLSIQVLRHVVVHKVAVYVTNCFTQALWGGRWQKGAAATMGEEVEQINSHFSQLGCSTKHMLPEGY